MRYNRPMKAEVAPEKLEETGAGSNPSAPRPSVLRMLGEFLRLVLVAAAIALPIRYFIAQPFIVRGESMEPNFQEGEYLVIDEFSYLIRAPKRGEVVVFRYPLNTRQYFIKRVIGLPGETLKIKENSVFITSAEHPGGFKLEESYLPEKLETRGSVEFVLGPSEYVVLGDNRPASSDSRSWGTLDRELITGRAFFRVLPPARFGVVSMR